VAGDPHESTHDAHDRDDVDERSALLAAAATGDLEPDEAEALEELLRTDPTASDELAGLLRVAAALPAAGAGWSAVEPPAALRASVLAATSGRRDDDEPLPDRRGRGAPPRPRARRTATLLAVAAVGVVLGAAGAVGVGAVLDAPPEGPPGTLGAVEAVTWRGEPDGVDAQASVVAHTWGTETVVDVTGLDLGAGYELVVLDATGAEVASGGFVGAQDVQECRLNAPVLREAADRLEVRDDDGALVMAADLPAV